MVSSVPAGRAGGVFGISLDGVNLRVALEYGRAASRYEPVGEPGAFPEVQAGYVPNEQCADDGPFAHPSKGAEADVADDGSDDYHRDVLGDADAVVGLAELHGERVGETVARDDDEVGYNLHVHAEGQGAASEHDTDDLADVFRGVEGVEHPHPEVHEVPKDERDDDLHGQVELVGFPPEEDELQEHQQQAVHDGEVPQGHRREYHRQAVGDRGDRRRAEGGLGDSCYAERQDEQPYEEHRVASHQFLPESSHIILRGELSNMLYINPSPPTGRRGLR